MSIFDFDDYYAFLRSYLASLPRKGRGEVNRIAKALNVHSTLVSQVFHGKKDFTLEQAHRLCAHLGLPALEADHFILLVLKARAGTAELRDYFRSKLVESKKQSLHLANRIKEHRKLTDTERAIFYSSWIYSAVRLFTSVGRGQTIDEVAHRFAISRKVAAEILSFLKATGLCIEDGGVYRLGVQHTHLEADSPFLIRNRANWRFKAMQRSEDLAVEEMMFTSPFSVSLADFQKIREMLVETIKATSKTIKDSPAEDIACMNIDLFWIRR